MYRKMPESGGQMPASGAAGREHGFGDFRIIAVTNRRLSAGDYFERIARIASSGADAVIVREKDLTEEEYRELAGRVMKICAEHGTECILHTFADAASQLGCRKIHLPLHMLREMRGGADHEASDAAFALKSETHDSLHGRFDTVGVSVHSLTEAEEAVRLGADYITAGHIFVTDCKKGAEPRGTDFLAEIVSSVPVPVFGIGGINGHNIGLIKETGAAGACIMSQMMNGEFYEKSSFL